MKSINISLGKMSQSKKVTAMAMLSWTEGVSTCSSAATEQSSAIQSRDATDTTTNRELPTRQHFMTRFFDSASESLGNAYATHHPLHHSQLSGIVISSLCEDVFTLVNTQWNVLHDYLKASEMLGTDLGNTVLRDGLLCIFRKLEEMHIQYRDTFLTDLERTCATANDFYRMMETTEEFWTTLQCTYPNVIDEEHSPVLSTIVNNLLTLYSSDAVYSAKRAHTFVVRAIHQSDIPSQLFSREWEDVFTSNEVVLSIIKTVEDYLYDFHNYLCNDLLYRKLVDSLIRAVVCFYVSNLVQTADSARRQLKRNKSAVFNNVPRALVRMMYDLELFRTYFANLTKELPSLAFVVEEEMSILVLVHECLQVAAGHCGTMTSLEEFVIVIHKYTGGNLEVTRHFMGDLWFLTVPPTQQAEIYNTISLMQAELQMMTLHMDEKACTKLNKNERDPLKGVRLVETLQDLYEERILQSQFSVCAPCVHVIQKAQRKRLGNNVTTERTPLNSKRLEVVSFAPRSEEFGRTLQEKLMEVLKLQNLNFVKNRPRPKFEFALKTTSS